MESARNNDTSMGACDEILIWYPGSSLQRAQEQDRINFSAVKRQTGLGITLFCHSQSFAIESVIQS